ncbi:prepilin-type N-terminal cleavage/methylation domain-containing protein [Ferrimonas balearica]|uniref:prepilin-type N-terminal cleavage/methylation domain-containing protein n=1 Tax=Ferrimonas balearica TaxID=44012 RepID=UPI001C99CB7A|nr:prepilin-type N-terminal cleavage/methylation domain-containing protein [Ferrimonas balearica]MBY5993127.1 prepilin-type N-terminal cleavage/methylation domain-containing protein [Ferrimonas balearica]
MRRLRPQRGLTLVELVVTLLVMGILALGVTGFITFGTRIYVESQAWQQELGKVRYGAQRLSRELRDAVPGSVSVTTDCIDFLPILASERYLSAPAPGNGNLDKVVAYAPGCCTDSDCDACEGQPLVLLDNYTPVSRTIDDHQCQGSNCERVRFTLDSDLPTGPFSAARRFFVAGDPVRWCVTAGGDLERNGVLMGEGIQNDWLNCDLANLDDPDCPFMELPPSLARNNIVRLQWWVETASQPQRFVQEVQLENVP